MPDRIHDPADCRDKTGDWIAYYDAVRRQEVRELLDEKIIAEHERNPIGYREFHTDRLQRVLNYFRTADILGKYFVYTEHPWQEYRIAEVVARGEQPRIHQQPVFQSEEAAMHGVFLRRVDDLNNSSGNGGHHVR